MNLLELSPEERERVLEMMRGRSDGYDGDVISLPGASLHGFFDISCKNEDGSTDWEIHKSNILTDYGRRAFAHDLITSCAIFTSPNSDTVSPLRYSLNDSSGHAQTMALTNGSVDWGSWSKSWSVTFGTPGFARTIGSVGLLGTALYASSSGVSGVVCYSLLVPSKVQGATQTLEMAYRLTMQIGV